LEAIGLAQDRAAILNKLILRSDILNCENSKNEWILEINCENYDQVMK
jgi:hypothetical protein